MIPKFNSRRIGSVNIFELEGVFSEPWVRRIKEGMNKKLEESSFQGLLLNLREVEKLDHSGAESILETAQKLRKCGILGHNLSTFFVAEHMRPNEPIPIFEKGKEAIGYFEKELADRDPNSSLQRRRFSRIEIALPLEFEFKAGGEAFFFEAVVTNLSEGGLYCYFLDSHTEELANRTIDPFDLRLLDLRLGLPGNERVEAKGKVLRTAKGPLSDTCGLALEFYDLRLEDRERVRSFLKQRRGSAKGESKNG